MSEPVYCMFCVHCKYPAPSGLAEACRHPDGVIGVVRPKLPTCIAMRSTNGKCGPSAIFFEKRMPEPVAKSPGFIARLFGRRK